jgi:hypothetical protein
MSLPVKKTYYRNGDPVSEFARRLAKCIPTQGVGHEYDGHTEVELIGDPNGLEDVIRDIVRDELRNAPRGPAWGPR